jgi:hypothetical protein
MRKHFNLILLFLALSSALIPLILYGLDLSEDTEKKGNPDRWLNLTLFKDWQKFDSNLNNIADESYFYLRNDNQVFFINNERFDYNKDARPDLFIINEIKNSEVFTEISIDTNYDGKNDFFIFKKNDRTYMKKIDTAKTGRIDQIEEYNDKEIKTAECIDTNNDGKTDDRYYYDPENGLLLREELDTNYDGKPDLWVIFEYNTDTSMKQCTIQKDNNFDGKIDEWHYSNNKRKIIKIEKDQNFDGKIDFTKNF